MRVLIALSWTGKCWVNPPGFSFSLTRGSLKVDCRIGEAPPPRSEPRVWTSLEVAHCKNTHSGSLFLEYADMAYTDPPWWAMPRVSSKPASSGDRRAFSFGGSAGETLPTTTDLSGV